MIPVRTRAAPNPMANLGPNFDSGGGGNNGAASGVDVAGGEGA